MPKTIHAGPLRISIYADGYIAAGMTACGRGNSEQDQTELAAMSLLVSEVTCHACMKTQAFSTAANDKIIPSITNIPRMRTAVFRARGVFDEEWNRRLRLRLGLPENSISADERSALLATEDDIYAGYARKKARTYEEK
jgi:hypothetical protein